MKIPFNKPFLTGKELEYIKDSVQQGKISGDGPYTKKCHDFFEKNYGFKKALLTTSCTDALEMAAILIDIKPGDEVIMPSFTFVSTANAFVLRGAQIVFADSHTYQPNVSAQEIKKLITTRTKAIVVVHYAGVACEMDEILEVAKKHDLFVIEDAAQAIDSYYKGKPLGSIGHLAAFSFHETKNVISGEGGMLVINDDRFVKRAEIIREKGTNRSQFFRGEVDKYGWVDIGSSFLPSDIIAAFLFAQLENIAAIQKKRLELWNEYYGALKGKVEKYGVQLPVIPDYATCNAHMFYIVCRDLKQRSGLIAHLKKYGILSVFHYLSLHKSDFYKGTGGSRDLPMSDAYTNRLLRLPLYFELGLDQVRMICDLIVEYLSSEA